MISASRFREIVSGRSSGAAAALARGVLALAEMPYSAAVRLRNRRYDRGDAEIQRVDVPVISVGNLTLGGTGKTPMVQWLAEWFAARGVSVALISRGYKADAAGGNDEAKELAEKLPGVPHLQNRDRIVAARQAIEQFHPGVILLDDAFQHRRLHRDLDIVLLDALEPFGFDHVFPRGTLREPASGLSRAHVVALSRADIVGDAERETIRRRVQQLAPDAAWLELEHRPTGWLAADGPRWPIDQFCGQRVAAFCGIGNPAGFRHTLDTLDVEIVGFREFPDHHRYSAADLMELARSAARYDDVAAVVCTHKDLVKIDAATIGAAPLAALTIGLHIRAGRERLEQRLVKLGGAEH